MAGKPRTRLADHLVEQALERLRRQGPATVAELFEPHLLTEPYDDPKSIQRDAVAIAIATRKLLMHPAIRVDGLGRLHRRELEREAQP